MKTANHNDKILQCTTKSHIYLFCYKSGV